MAVQDVDPPEPLHGSIDKPFELRVVADIGSTARARPPAASMRCAVSAPAAALRSATTNAAPSRAMISAPARPMPEPAPVTIATLPLRIMPFPTLDADALNSIPAAVKLVSLERSQRVTMSKAKDDFIARTVKVWNPGKTLQWQREGVDLVIDRREGYFLHDMDGRRLIDLHLNGGIYSLGHRNPEVIAALTEGMERFDIGNHHFPSIARTMLAEMLQKHTPEGLQYSMFASGGGGGDRHRAEERAPCDREAEADLPRSAAITAIPGWR